VRLVEEIAPDRVSAESPSSVSDPGSSIRAGDERTDGHAAAVRTTASRSETIPKSDFVNELVARTPPVHHNLTTTFC